jgi:hypothetical protein
MDIYDIGFVQSMKDLSNFFKFRKEIKKEIKRRDSLFNKFKLQKNWLGNIVYVQIDCDDNDLMNADYDAERMLDIKLKPIVNYLSGDLGWGDYLVPQVSNFVDEDGNITLSYGVLFVFTGYRLTMLKFIINLLVSLGILGAGIWALCHFLV